MLARRYLWARLMVRLPFLYLASALLFTGFPQAGFTQTSSGERACGPWKLQKDKDGIQVYTRQNPKSVVDEFRSVMTINTELRYLKVILENVTHYPQWQENCTSAELLKTEEGYSKYVHYKTDVPWPVKDRDIVILKRKQEGADGTITYTMEPRPDFIPMLESHIRIRNSFGSWRLIPENGKVTIVHQFYGDPEGSIPAWITNLFIIEGPFKTFQNLRALVEALESRNME